MRILFIIGSYPPNPCGVGDYSKKLIESLAKVSDLKIGVLTTSSFGQKFVQDKNIEFIHPINEWTIRNLPKIILKILKWKPQIVHYQFPSQGYKSPLLPSLMPVICRLSGIKVIQTWHEPHTINKQHPLKSFFYFYLLSLGASGLIFVRQNYLDLIPWLFVRLTHRIPQIFIKNASTLPVVSLTEKSNKLKSAYLGRLHRLIVFFGFVNPNKGVDLIFKIANPATDVVIIAGSFSNSSYQSQILSFAQSLGWNVNQIYCKGFLPPEESAELLAIADAVILPFREGSGEWNTSVHSALAQGTLVITTAVDPRGDEPERNLYTAAPNGWEEMRIVLNKLAGRRTPVRSNEEEWSQISGLHISFYKKFMTINGLVK